MNSYCAHDGEGNCVKKEEKEFLDKAEKEEIAEIVGAFKDEEFVAEKKFYMWFRKKVKFLMIWKL